MTLPCKFQTKRACSFWQAPIEANALFFARRKKGGLQNVQTLITAKLFVSGSKKVRSKNQAKNYMLILLAVNSLADLFNFLVKLNKSASKSFQTLRKVYGEECTARAHRVFEWHKRFREGWTDFKDDERSGRPSTSKTTEKI